MRYLAAVYSMAEALGQAATQAPQPMHSAASMESSASSLDTGRLFASGAPPGYRDEAARLNDAVEGVAVHDEILNDRESLGTPRFEEKGITVLEAAHMELAHCGATTWTMGDAVDHEATHAADPLTAVMIEGDGLLTSGDQPSFTTSSISRKDISALTSRPRTARNCLGHGRVSAAIHVA